MSDARHHEARRHLDTLHAYDGPKLTFMEVCGSHTMAAAKAGLRTLLPANIRLISGPGCPVCVTPVGTIDHALALARRPEVVITTFGDMLRVPGSARTRDEVPSPPALQHEKAAGADVRVVYSPLDALQIARDNPDREVVFLAVGFETTVPGIAAALRTAHETGLTNFSALCANKTVPEALRVLTSSDDLRLDGLLCPGHVSIILGPEVYAPIAAERGVACAIAGFETGEILRGLVALVDQVVRREPTVDNCYPGAVKAGGNPRARAVMAQVFEPADSIWRGLGSIPGSGLVLRPEFAHLDAGARFDVTLPAPVEPKGCRCGDVLRGRIEPAECGLFGTVCTPENPRGACMVSSEGSCAAAFHYGVGS